MKKEVIRTAHIVANEGDFAKTILMPGDPLRSKYIATKFLKNPKLINDIRGIQGYTGLYKNKRVSVMAHGMGMPSVTIYAHELFNFFGVENIIRVGTCGSFASDLDIKDILLGEYAWTSSNIGEYLGNKKKKVVDCDPVLLEQADEVCKSHGIVAKKSKIATLDIIYNQGQLLSYFKKKNCVAVDMETYALYCVAKQSNKKALSILTVSDNTITGSCTTAEERQSSFDNMIILALETAIKLK